MIRKTIIQLSKQTLEGKQQLNDFYDNWPEEANRIKFLHEVYEDLEDSIQHMPGRFFSNEVDLPAWEKSNMYMVVYLDYQLLMLEENYDILHEIRLTILNHKKGKVNKFFIDTEISRLLDFIKKKKDS